MKLPDENNQKFVYDKLHSLCNYTSKIDEKDIQVLREYIDIDTILVWSYALTEYKSDSVEFQNFVILDFILNYYKLYESSVKVFTELYPEQSEVSRVTIKFLLGSEEKSKTFNLSKSFPTTNTVHGNFEGTLLCYDYIKRNADNVDEGILIWKDKMFKEYPKSSLPCFIRAARLGLLFGDSIMQYHFLGRSSRSTEINICKYICGLTLSMLYCIDVYGISDELKKTVEGYYGYSLQDLSDELYKLTFNIDLNRSDIFVFEFMLNWYKHKIRKLLTIISYSHNFKLYEENVLSCEGDE